MSEPQSSGALAVEMAGLDVIPESDRKGKPSDLFMPWFAANISVLGISWGSWVLGFGLSLGQAVVVSVVGVALSFLVCGLIAIAGKRGSAPTLVLSRAAFGFNGNRISAAISWILTVGWETFLAIMAVQATATVMGALGFTNHVVAQIIALILVVVLAAGSGILGFEAIMKVQTWITWATAALTIVYLVLVAPTIDFAVLSSRPSAPLTAVLGAGCMLLVGFGFGWINAAADYSRYLPRAASTKGVVGWTTVGAALPTVILVFFGILLVGSADESLSEAIGGDPIGALTTLLPTWFLIPFALVAILNGAVQQFQVLRVRHPQGVEEGTDQRNGPETPVDHVVPQHPEKNRYGDAQPDRVEDHHASQDRRHHVSGGGNEAQQRVETETETGAGHPEDLVQPEGEVTADGGGAVLGLWEGF